MDLQLPSNPSGRRFVNCLSNLCLHCITLVSGLLLPLNQYCTRSMRREWEAYYHVGDQLDADRRILKALTLTAEKRRSWCKDIYQRLIPTLGQHSWKLSDDGLCWSHKPPSSQAE